MKRSRRTRSIGVFDSGFGGLVILRSIAKMLGEYDFVYLGDTARTPYGTRSMDVVHEFTRQAVDFLFSKECGLVILACNTASSEALRKIQQQYLPAHHPDKRVLGVLIPASEQAATLTKNKRVGVLATSGTVRSGSFQRELKKLDKRTRVFQNPCPLLVPIIEEGEQHNPATTLLIRQYLAPLLRQRVDTIILGCTHYGVIEKKIRACAGRNVRIISEGGVVAKKLKDYLRRHPEIESTLGKHHQRTFYSTDITDRFSRLGSRLYGQRVRVRKIRLPS